MRLNTYFKEEVFQILLQICKPEKAIVIFSEICNHKNLEKHCFIEKKSRDEDTIHGYYLILDSFIIKIILYLFRLHLILELSEISWQSKLQESLQNKAPMKPVVIIFNYHSTFFVVSTPCEMKNLWSLHHHHETRINKSKFKI